MTRTANITVDVHMTDEEWSSAMAQECRASLTSDPKWLSPVWFYDATGSRLFDEITRLTEYYPTRCERSLLEEHSASIVAASGADTLVELGSGTSDKTRCILDAMAAAGRLERYVPFDVSEETLRDAAGALVEEYPGLEVHAVVGDFGRHLGTLPREGKRLVAFLGGTIGNLDAEQRHRFLFDLDCAMEHDDHLLLGIDLVKDRTTLVEAYDDAAGVTAAFNRNALVHLNDRFGADFDPDAFAHVAVWNVDSSRIEMRLRSARDQAVVVDALDLTVHFEAGEELRTEISAKFTVEAITEELWQAGFVTDSTWEIAPGYGLVLAHPYC